MRATRRGGRLRRWGWALLATWALAVSGACGGSPGRPASRDAGADVPGRDVAPLDGGGDTPTSPPDGGADGAARPDIHAPEASDGAAPDGALDAADGPAGDAGPPDAADGGPDCADHDPCTIDEVDPLTGACGHRPRDCSHQDAACRHGACDPETGVCRPVFVADGTSCDDGDPCSTGDRCLAGVCTGEGGTPALGNPCAPADCASPPPCAGTGVVGCLPDLEREAVCVCGPDHVPGTGGAGGCVPDPCAGPVCLEPHRGRCTAFAPYGPDDVTCGCDPGYVLAGGACQAVDGSCAAPLALDLAAGSAEVTLPLTAGTGVLVGSCGGAGAERVFVFTLADHARLTATAWGTDTVLYVRDSCQATATERACDDDSNPPGDHGSRLRDLDLPPGTYHLVLDTYAPDDGGLVTLSVALAANGCTAGAHPCAGTLTCLPGTAPDAATCGCPAGTLLFQAAVGCVPDPCLTGPCDDRPATACQATAADAVTCACVAGHVRLDPPDGPCVPEACATAQTLVVTPGTTQTVSGATAGDGVAGSTDCGGHSSGERVYALSLPGPARLHVTVSGFDTVSYLRSECGAEHSQLACNDDDDVQPGHGSGISTAGLPPGTYWLFVDGYDGDVGPFSLTVEGLPAPCAADPCTQPHRTLCVAQADGTAACACTPGYAEDPATGACVAVADLASWTLLVYLDGDNDLDAYGVGDTEEMMAVGSTDEVAVVVQWDRPGPGTHRYRVDAGELVLLETLPEVDMGHWESLADFAIWGAAAYPAERYALVVWDHGDGWAKSAPAGGKGIAWDDTADSWISVARGDYGRALARIVAALDRPLDLVGHDACLMGMWEVAAATAPYAGVLVASEELEPDEGWRYDTWLGSLVAAPDAPAPLVGVWAAQTYFDAGADFSTLSVVDLAAQPGLDAAVDGLAAAVRATEAPWAWLGPVRDVTQVFDEAGHIDLADLCLRLVAEPAVPDAVAAAAADVLAALSESLHLSAAHVGEYPDAHGLAIYLPSRAEDYDPAYGLGAGAVWSAHTGWDEMLRWLQRK